MKTRFKIFVGSLFFFALVGIFARFSPVLASTLNLNPPFSTVDKGKDLKVDIVLKAQNELVDGVDAILSYDNNVLAVKSIKEGSFFGRYPLKRDNGGQIKITALSPKEGVRIFGEIVIATITFDILDNGQTKINFSFEKNSTKDSNVALHTTSQDSLTGVTNGSYSVSATPENLKKAAAKKAQGTPSALIIFIIIVLIIVAVIFFLLRRRKPKEDVFVPEPFPMDQPPKES